MLLTENDKRWSNIITEELHVTDPARVQWMSKYAQVHELYEAAQNPAQAISGGIYATPLNTIGMGNPMNPIPGTNGAGRLGPSDAVNHIGDFTGSTNAHVGSGDIPMSTLPMALEIAAMTVGFELVPVIPSSGPWTMLSYMDFPYAGGKLPRFNESSSLNGKGPGKENKPIYVKVDVTKSMYTTAPEFGQTLVFKTKNAGGDLGEFTGKFIGFSRINGATILEVIEAVDKDGASESIAYVFSGWIAKIYKYGTIGYEDKEKIAEFADDTVYGHADLVSAAADHIQGFSNFATGNDNPMTRDENETGVGNMMGARMFTKLVQMGAYEVTGAVTRQQLQDMPLYGIDVVGQILEHMQNEISQAINNRILDRVFKLGVENYKTQREYQGVDLNLFIYDSTASKKDVARFASAKYFKDIAGNTLTTGKWAVPNSMVATTAENVMTNQRRIMSRVLYAKNLIANVSRRGMANWVVTNFSIASALQDCAGFVIAPMVNTLTQDNSQSLYFAGSIAGLNIYVDPYMPADDMRICVGRKSDGKTPGVIFMPYILADTVQTVAEGTMAPKLLVNSRFAIVDAGFYPEQNYYTFMVDSSYNAATDNVGELPSAAMDMFI